MFNLPLPLNDSFSFRRDLSRFTVLGSSRLDAFSFSLKEFSRLHYCSFIKVLSVNSATALLY